MSDIIKEYDINPYDSTAFDKAWRYAADDDKAQLRPMYNLFHPLTPLLLENWENANPKSLHEIYKIASQEYAIPSLQLLYLRSFAFEEHDLLHCYNVCKHDYNELQLVFEMLTDFYKTDHPMLKVFYEERIKIPHRQLHDTYEQYSAFISASFQSEYTAIMRDASKALQSTEKKMRFYEIHEEEVLESSKSECWKAYIEDMLKYAPQNAVPLLHRSLWAHSENIGNPEWCVNWELVLKANYDADLARQYVKTYKQLRQYSFLVYGLEKAELEKLDKHIDTIIGFASDAEAVAYYYDRLSVERKWGNTKVMEIGAESIKRDRSFSIVQYCVSLIGAKALPLIQAIKDTRTTSAWETCAEYYAKFDKAQLQSHLGVSVSRYDDPGRLSALIRRYAYTHFDYAISLVASEEPEPAKKRLRVAQESEAPRRNREDFSVRLHIPYADANTVRDFLGFSPVSVKSHPQFSVVELRSEDEVMEVLRKNQQPFKETPVKVERALGCTVFMTNYPPSYTPDEIRLLISTHGSTPLDVRVLLRANKRFCYVEFGSEEETNHIVGKLDKMHIDGYQLVLQHSNPTLRKKRDDLHARQVHVRNVSFNADENDLRAFFSGVESVSLPLSGDARHKGHKHNGFGFITFHTSLDAKDALLKNGQALKGRSIRVEALKAKKETPRAPPEPTGKPAKMVPVLLLRRR